MDAGRFADRVHVHSCDLAIIRQHSTEPGAGHPKGRGGMHLDPIPYAYAIAIVPDEIPHIVTLR